MEELPARMDYHPGFRNRTPTYNENCAQRPRTFNSAYDGAGNDNIKLADMEAMMRLPHHLIH